ncbi:MAG TPA: SirB2 family protein [Gammaproteobacteria bacterium]
MPVTLYPWLKGLHLACIALSLGLFLLRGWWTWRSSPWRHSAWARWVPHVNDTLLLLAGIGLALLLRQYPLVEPWLSAKLGGLLLHIGLGVVALRGWLQGAWRGAAWAGSLAAFAYVVAVALSRSPQPWLG